MFSVYGALVPPRTYRTRALPAGGQCKGSTICMYYRAPLSVYVVCAIGCASVLCTQCVLQCVLHLASVFQFASDRTNKQGVSSTSI